MFAFSGKLKNLFAFSHTLSTKRCINGTRAIARSLA
jgi:hypothetical protein